jgi:hypothetical protein
MNRADSARDRQEASGSTISREAAISVLPKMPTADATPSASPLDYPAVSGLDLIGREALPDIPLGYLISLLETGAHHRNIRSAGLRTPAGPRLSTWV